LEEGLKDLLKRISWGQEEGEGEKSSTRPKFTHRQVHIKKSRAGFLGGCIRGCWVNQARAYLIIVRGLFVFLITANSTRLDLASPHD